MGVNGSISLPTLPHHTLPLNSERLDFDISNSDSSLLDKRNSRRERHICRLLAALLLSAQECGIIGQVPPLLRYTYKTDRESGNLRARMCACSRRYPLHASPAAAATSTQLKQCHIFLHSFVSSPPPHKELPTSCVVCPGKKEPKNLNRRSENFPTGSQQPHEEEDSRNRAPSPAGTRVRWLIASCEVRGSRVNQYLVPLTCVEFQLSSPGLSCEAGTKCRKPKANASR